MTQVVDGFSLTNRWLLYTSVMLSPAQYLSGIGSNCPSNLGFLAYNIYTQIKWYKAVQGRELHALSLLPVHFNFTYTLSYLGGVTSGNLIMSLILATGTAGVLILNTISAWTSWATNLAEGYGEYRFFFFGWRVLSPGWRTFILTWQIGDSIFALVAVVLAFYYAIMAVVGEERDVHWYKYPAIILGSVMMLMMIWPLILWTELIVAKNGIESETDMLAVWLFVAQCVAMIIPSCGWKWSRSQSD